MTDPINVAIQRLTEAMAASREVTDRQLSALTATVERTSQNVDRAVDRIEQSVIRIEQSSARVEHQVGVMSEHLTAIDIKLERLIDAINAHLRIAQKQTDNIAELTKLVASQANTVAALINRTA